MINTNQDTMEKNYHTTENGFDTKLNDRILCWLDIDLEQFGIVKFLKEKHPCDLYAIIDINLKAKNFFLNQKFVKFKKVWYYRDQISKLDNYDMNYLISIEKKYKINLWNLAYTERYFYKYNQYYKFNRKQILSLLEQECKFFEKVLDEIKPQFLVIKVTDYHKNHLFQKMCKGLGIKILTYGRTRIGFRAMISEDADLIDLPFPKKPLANGKRSFSELKQYIKGYSNQQNNFRREYRNSLVERIRSGIEFLRICNNKYRKYFANYGRTRIRVLYLEFIFLIKRWYRERFINKVSLQKIEEKIPFVYFPLHLEPERALSIAAPYYTNQLEVITHIAKSLPMSYKLYVKDHPGMRDVGWREISFYKKMLELPNVRLFHHEFSGGELLKNCSLVITIAGTIGMKAAFYGKPAIIFADVIYSSLPSLSRVKNIEDLPKLIRDSLEKKVKKEDLNNYINYIEDNSFEFDYFKLQTVVNNTFFNRGFLKDIEIPIQKMDNFLHKNRNLLEKLADEHIKKIKELKNSNVIQ